VIGFGAYRMSKNEGLATLVGCLLSHRGGADETAPLLIVISVNSDEEL